MTATSSWRALDDPSHRPLEDNVVMTTLSRWCLSLYDPSFRATCLTRTSLSDSSLTTRRPTMLDVAALAGVGLKTVSRVVNSEPGVSPELEARVRRAIEQLNYRRDANAATLRRLGRKTHTIGLVLEDVANPFAAELQRAGEDATPQPSSPVFAANSREH